MKSSNPVFSLKIQSYSYLVENSQKATLNFDFKSRFSVKPSKFQIYFLQKIVVAHGFTFIYFFIYLFKSLFAVGIDVSQS